MLKSSQINSNIFSAVISEKGRSFLGISSLFFTMMIMTFVNTGISVVHRLTKSQVYPLMFGSQNVPVYCHMGNFGCGDGGWTLAMKIDGKKVCYFTIKEYHCCKLYTTITFLFSTF